MTLTVIEQRAKGWDEETLRLLEDVTAMASQVVQEIRTLSYLLHPPLLDEAGLIRHFPGMWTASPNAAT